MFDACFKSATELVNGSMDMPKRNRLIDALSSIVNLSYSTHEHPTLDKQLSWFKSMTLETAIIWVPAVKDRSFHGKESVTAGSVQLG